MNKKGTDNGVKKLSRLKPLPIDFNEEKHEYTWEPTKARLAYSVTQILRVLKTEWQLQMIEKTKATWAPRGTSVHAGWRHSLMARQPSRCWPTLTSSGCHGWSHCWLIRSGRYLHLSRRSIACATWRDPLVAVSMPSVGTHRPKVLCS